MLAVGVPAGDAILELGWAVKVDFLGALDGPVFEDAVAAGTGVALEGGRVRSGYDRQIGSCGMVSSWRREDTMLGTFQSSAEAVRRVRTFQARPPASDGVEMVPVPAVAHFFKFIEFFK